MALKIMIQLMCRRRILFLRKTWSNWLKNPVRWNSNFLKVSFKNASDRGAFLFFIRFSRKLCYILYNHKQLLWLNSRPYSKEIL